MGKGVVPSPAVSRWEGAASGRSAGGDLRDAPSPRACGQVLGPRQETKTCNDSKTCCRDFTAVDGSHQGPTTDSGNKKSACQLEVIIAVLEKAAAGGGGVGGRGAEVSAMTDEKPEVPEGHMPGKWSKTYKQDCNLTR